MISTLRATERHHEGRAGSGTWGAFSRGTGVGALVQFEEQRLEPGGGAWVWRGEGELVTWVCDGSLAFEDSRGGGAVLRASDVQVIGGGDAGWWVRNASSADRARGFQLTFDLPPGARVAARQHRRFGVSERREHLHLLTTFEARAGSLRTRALARIYSGVLERGRHVVHALNRGHAAWLHVVEGECTTQETLMHAGDGARFVGEPRISLTARLPSEVLLVEVLPHVPWVTRARRRARVETEAPQLHLQC